MKLALAGVGFHSSAGCHERQHRREVKLKPGYVLTVQAGLKSLQCLAFAEEDEADAAGGGGARGGGRCSGAINVSGLRV